MCDYVFFFQVIIYLNFLNHGNVLIAVEITFTAVENTIFPNHPQSRKTLKVTEYLNKKINTKYSYMLFSR